VVEFSSQIQLSVHEFKFSRSSTKQKAEQPPHLLFSIQYQFTSDRYVQGFEVSSYIKDR